MSEELVGIKFPFEIANGRVATSVVNNDGSKVERVHEQIKMIIGTIKGERENQEFGFNSNQFVFSNFDEALLPYYKESIIEALSPYLSDLVIIDDVEFDKTHMNDGEVYIKIYWKLKTSTDSESETTEVKL